MSIEFLQAGPDNAGEITELFFASDHRLARNKNYWFWSNINTPYEKSYSVIGVDGSKIISHYSILPLIFSVNGKRIKAGFGQQAVVHPHYRNFHIINETIRRCLKLAKNRGCSFVYGFPNKNFWPVQEKLMKWHIVSHFNSIEYDFKEIEQAIGDLPHSDIVDFKRINEDNVAKIPLLDRKMGINLVKEYAYIKWRILRHPIYHYMPYLLCVGNKYIGYVVLKCYYDYERKIKKGHLIDYSLTNSDSIIIYELLHFMVEKFRCFDIELLSLWLNETDPLFKITNELVHRRTGFETVLALKDIRNEIGDDLYSFQSWNLCMSYSDAF